MRKAIFFVFILFLVSIAGHPQSVDLSSAQIYRSQGDYHKAIEHYKKAIADYEAQIAEMKTQYPDEAVFEKKAKGEMKKLHIASYELGDCYLKLQDYPATVKSFDKALEYGDKYYTEILETRKDLWIKFYNDGVPLFNDKKYSEAVTFFELALLIDPENIDGFKERGLCYVMMSTLEKDSIKAKELEDKALSDFDYIIARDPEGKELPIRINKASIFYRNGQYDKAEPVYLEILKFDPQNIDAISKLALIYQNAGESEKAIEMYDKVTKTNPNNPDLWFNMGILYFQMGNFAKAQESFDKVLDMNPNDVETMMNLVSSFWKAEMYKEAIPYLERVVAIEPMNVLAWQFLSVAYAKNGETTKANEAFKKYKELGGTIK